jgi:hypothetical protein
MRLAIACGLAAALVAGCGKKSRARAPDVAGLDAVPASAHVVIVADAARLAGSPLVERAVDQLLLRDADLATRWQRLRESCKLEVEQLRHVILAIGPAPGPSAATGPVLMVATGKLVETELASCVRAMVGQGGGTLTAKDLAGRTLYQARDGNRTMFFAFGRADTVVLGSNEAFVIEALGPGAKVTSNPELVRWMNLADQKAPLWAAGRVDERVRGGLVRASDGQLAAGPVAIVLSADPSDGARLDLGAVMASAADAKTLESFANGQLGLLAIVAQARRLGKVVDKVAIRTEGEVVRFRAALGPAEVNQLLSALDEAEVPAQDSPPAPEPGSAEGP